MNQKLDAETQKVLTDAEEVANLIESKGWGVIHGKLTEKILDLQNINNIDVSDPATLSSQLLGRKLASDLLFAWLKGDVFGLVEQAKANNMVDAVDRESFVSRD